MIDLELLNKAVELAHKREFEEAEIIYSKLLKQEPNNNLVLEGFRLAKLNQVKVYTETGKLADAELICVNYLKQYQNDFLMWIQLGFLKELIYSDDCQAFQCYEIAYKLGHKKALYNMAVSFYKQGKLNEAETYYQKMLEIYPDDINTMVALGLCYLKQKKFKEGYKLLYTRNKINYAYGDKFDENVVVFSDQGFGDFIQFARYLPFLKKKVKTLTVAAPKSLIELFQQNFPEIKFVLKNEINPEVQSIRITDLAYILDMDFEHIPYAQGYLNSQSKEINSNRLKVGLCWEAGSSGIRTMINRTINIRLFEDILSMNKIQFYSFQIQDSLKGNERYPQMINLAKEFSNFNDTAKALKSMDLLITVDTAVAHLAGALGVKTFLLLPYASDWRWFSDTKSTPWYKSIEIFKQNNPIDWEQPLGDIKCRLKKYSL